MTYNTRRNRKMIHNIFQSLILLLCVIKIGNSLTESSFFKNEISINDKVINVPQIETEKLLSASRLLEDRAVDVNFLSSYSVKYLGCHQVSQWRGQDEGYDESATQIQTKHLVRYRMCPNGACNDGRENGCSSKYGDYVVDINTFVTYYLQGREDIDEYLCEKYEENCENQCANDDNVYCLEDCFNKYGAKGCEGGYRNLDVADYAQCVEYDEFTGADDDNNGNSYYLGPYCGEQGGSIYLGLFTDNTCQTLSSCGGECFYNTMGFSLPYSDQPIVTNDCTTCSESIVQNMKDGNNNNDNNDSQDDDDEAREFCQNFYKYSGKCETRMYIEYPNESACTFIEGIKVLREDGVIRSSSVKKSKLASASIGVGMSVALLLTTYVYYLSAKLERARVNLSSHSSMS